jgi:sugar lactone lactonase YvrE
MSAQPVRNLRSALVLAVTAALVLPAGTGAAAAAAPAAGGPALAAPQAASPAIFPTTIPLPDGFRPEGIAIGAAPFAFFGSLADGAIYRANLITGAGRIVSPGPGTPSVGLALDHRGRLFVAGGNAGNGRVVHAVTGQVLASYQFAAGASFVNDVIVTRHAAWFTDSLNPVLYQVPLGRRGALPDPAEVVTVPLTGDFELRDGFNANGISRTPDGNGLLLIQSNTGLLFRVETNGVATEVDLAGETLPNGDGILLRGRTLYVVQNQLNQVAVVRLDRSGTSGTVLDRVTDPRFDIPTTVAAFGNRLYLPNARFTTPPTPTTPYSAVAIPGTGR